MIAHVVCFKMKPFANGNPKSKNIPELIVRLKNLKNEIPQIHSLDVGINDNGGEYDIVLTELFENAEALGIYDTSMPHIRIKEYIGRVCDKMTVTDYPF